MKKDRTTRSTPNQTPNTSPNSPSGVTSEEALDEYFLTVGRGYKERAIQRWEAAQAQERVVLNTCPCCGGPYNHSEAACQGDYLGNFEPEYWEEAWQEWEDLG